MYVSHKISHNSFRIEFYENFALSHSFGIRALGKDEICPFQFFSFKNAHNLGSTWICFYFENSSLLLWKAHLFSQTIHLSQILK